MLIRVFLDMQIYAKTRTEFVTFRTGTEFMSLVGLTVFAYQVSTTNNDHISQADNELRCCLQNTLGLS